MPARMTEKYVWFAVLFSFCESFLDLWTVLYGSAGVRSPQTCLCNSTAAVLTRGEVRKHLERQERDGHEEKESGLVLMKHCEVCLFVQMSP